ncbi:hypothetical protein F5J12DRAFT_848283 [Pisolithus orientalis]|uniref:uncharacterized protein n=1 Tax=Pisolithus orientalis TaxID=936130 RepID=UPI0022243BA5|nr:uncharacterized protein F5J12DRAFT_848283 [Pisolithus orientalis]KAI5998911.1 hypothetical protein F5J12DRAFT_848283 [Pisolithus orientalis]
MKRVVLVVSIPQTTRPWCLLTVWGSMALFSESSFLSVRAITIAWLASAGGGMDPARRDLQNNRSHSKVLTTISRNTYV